MVESVTVSGIENPDIVSLIDWDDAIAEKRIVADVCFDSKRIMGCYICPLYKCVKRDL